jgi:hypothetical protein
MNGFFLGTVSQTQISSFSPSSLPGLQLLIDVNSITGTSGSTIPTITEQSSNGYILTSGSPFMITNELNGRKILRYNNTEHTMPSTSYGMFRNQTGGTVYAVSKRLLTSAHWIFRMYTEAAGTNTRFGLGSSATGFEGAGGRRVNADTFSEAKNPTGTSNTWKIEGGTVDYVNRVINYYANGSLYTTNSNPFYTSGNTTDSNSTGGAVMDNAVGDLAFLAVYNTVHTSGQTANMFSYLNQLFAIY